MKRKTPPQSPILRTLVLLLFLANLFYTMPKTFAAESPQATFTFLPVIPYVNEDITFDASASTLGEGSIVLYNWNFGDNTTGTGMVIEKSYTEAANYTVTLTVTNSAGANDTTSKLVTILPEPEGPAIDLYNQRGGKQEIW